MVSASHGSHSGTKNKAGGCSACHSAVHRARNSQSTPEAGAYYPHTNTRTPLDRPTAGRRRACARCGSPAPPPAPPSSPTAGRAAPVRVPSPRPGPSRRRGPVRLLTPDFSGSSPSSCWRARSPPCSRAGAGRRTRRRSATCTPCRGGRCTASTRRSRPAPWWPSPRRARGAGSSSRRAPRRSSARWSWRRRRSSAPAARRARRPGASRTAPWVRAQERAWAPPRAAARAWARVPRARRRRAAPASARPRSGASCAWVAQVARRAGASARPPSWPPPAPPPLVIGVGYDWKGAGMRWARRRRGQSRSFSTLSERIRRAAACRRRCAGCGGSIGGPARMLLSAFSVIQPAGEHGGEQCEVVRHVHPAIGRQTAAGGAAGA